MREREKERESERERERVRERKNVCVDLLDNERSLAASIRSFTSFY